MSRLLVVVAAVMTAGCVSVEQIPMNASSADAIKDKEIALSERAKPEFVAMTSTNGLFGPIGAAASVSGGNELVKKHGIEDPALYIAHTLAADLQSRYNARLSPKAVPIASDDIAEAVENANGADLVLDVRTLNWSFVYSPISWGKYRVIYSARLRLVDAKSARVVAEGGCRRVPEHTAQAPTYDKLVANSAERLKQELKTAADFCISEFKAKTLALQ
jgi:hypothetical protein